MKALLLGLLISTSALAAPAASDEEVICNEAHALLSTETTAMVAGRSKENSDYQILICPGKAQQNCLDTQTDNYQFTANKSEFKTIVEKANELGCSFSTSAKTLDLVSAQSRQCLGTALMLFRPNHPLTEHAVVKLKSMAGASQAEFNSVCVKELAKTPLEVKAEYIIDKIAGHGNDDDAQKSSELQRKQQQSTGGQELAPHGAKPAM